MTKSGHELTAGLFASHPSGPPVESEALRELGFLHDAIVRSVTYDFSDPKTRVTRILVECHENSGHPSWSGRRLLLIARGVSLSSHHLWNTAGQDTINFVHPTISARARSEFLARRPANSSLPGQEIGIAFNSGAELELVCDAFEVELAD